MPLYEYRCQGCGSQTEVMQRFSDPPLSTCDECGGELKKLISAPAFHLKGEGWYVTDYARKKEKGQEKKDGAAKAKDDGGKQAKDGGGAKAKDDGGATKAERSASATPPKSTSSTT